MPYVHPPNGLLDFRDITNNMDRRQDRRNGNHEGDMTRFQFWPTAVAMGSLVGKHFIQVSSICDEVVKADRD